MSVTESDRLDLRQAFEKLFADERLARIAMEALPPIDYSNLATKQDLAALSAELRGEMTGLSAELRGEMATLGAELRGEMAELRGDATALRSEMNASFATLFASIDSAAAQNIRFTVLTVLSATVMLGGYVTAVLG